MKELDKKLNQIDDSKILRNVKKQSTKRATFNITSFANTALKELSKRPGVKHKEIFDFVCEDEDYFDLVVSSVKEKSTEKSPKEVFQKTLLLSEKSLKKLNEVSKKENIKRDMLASYIIYIFEGLLKNDEAKEREGFVKGQEYITKVWSYLAKEKSKLKKEIGDDHPLIQAFGNFIRDCENLSNSIDEHLSSNKPFNPDLFWE